MAKKRPYKQKPLQKAMAFGTIAQKVSFARLVHGLKQVELASMADLSPSTISKLENGKMLDPSFATIWRISHVTGFALEFFKT